jgi:uncharacterized membrane protein
VIAKARRLSGERGQTTVLALALALVCFGVAGLVVDGTRAFIHRRTLQNAADAAALAGANRLDLANFYRSEGASRRLDLVDARRAAMEMLGRRGLRAEARIQVSGRRTAIILRSEVPTGLLRMIGIRAIPVAVEAVSEPILGALPEDP